MEISFAVEWTVRRRAVGTSGAAERFDGQWGPRSRGVSDADALRVHCSLDAQGGYGPEVGDFIFVPDSHGEFLGRVPEYVRFSSFAQAPTLRRGPQLRPNGFEDCAREFRDTHGFGELDTPLRLAAPIELDIHLDD